MAGLSGSFVALRHRNFRWFYIASTVNLIGTTMSGVALAFAVLSISDSATDLGYVLAASTIPTILFLLLGGVVADRMSLTVVIRLGATLLGVTQAAAAALVITGTAADLDARSVSRHSTALRWPSPSRPCSRSRPVWCRPTCCSRRTSSSRWPGAPSG